MNVCGNNKISIELTYLAFYIQVMVWDGRSPDSPVHTLSAHQAAVKAISWCPWQPKTLASGGGTNDREIRFWNTATGACINSVDTGISKINKLIFTVIPVKDFILKIST